MIRGNYEFAIDLYRRLAGAGTGNLFLSPHSISTAMAMADVGARGETAKEIEAVLEFPFGGASLAKAFRDVIDDVNRHEPGFDLVTANALWAAASVEFLPQYATLMREQLGATIETLDFAHASEAARAHINEWVAAITRQKIRELIGAGMLTPDTLLVLTNAIYMKAAWKQQFVSASTDPNGRFHGPSGDSTVPMMKQTAVFPLFRGEGVAVIELPYAAEELSMLIVLPDALDGLGRIESELTAPKLDDWRARTKPRRVALSLPRFEIEGSLQLSDVLRAMGVRLAFDMTGLADFSGIAASEKLAISEVIHKARVDVTEEGTEAAAATGMLLRASAMFREPPAEVFLADHPFLFVIRCRGSLLFVGRLVQPAR